MIEFSHKLMSNIQPVVTRKKNTIRKEKTFDLLSIQRRNDSGTKILGKRGISKERNKNNKRAQTVAAPTLKPLEVSCERHTVRKNAHQPKV